MRFEQWHYNNHPPKDPPTLLWIWPEAAGHPVLTGVPTNELRVTSWLYRSRRLAATVTPLMNGRVEGRSEIEPVAWFSTNRDCRVFYTSLGSPNDFLLPACRHLLLNGTLWALRRPIPPETGK